MKQKVVKYDTWLVVSTHLKNISQIGSFPHVGVKIKNIRNHRPDTHFFGHPLGKGELRILFQIKNYVYI